MRSQSLKLFCENVKRFDVVISTSYDLKLIRFYIFAELQSKKLNMHQFLNCGEMMLNVFWHFIYTSKRC